MPESFPAMPETQRRERNHLINPADRLVEENSAFSMALLHLLLFVSTSLSSIPSPNSVKAWRSWLDLIIELGVGSMCSVTEGFVFGSAATAESHAIPQFVGLAIGANERYPSAHPQRAAAILRRVLHHSDRLRKLWFNWLASLFVYRNQTARGAASYLTYKLRTYSFIVGFFYLVPNLTVWIAKACECT